MNRSRKAASALASVGYEAARSQAAYKYTISSASSPITAASSDRRASGSKPVGKPSVP